jgi:hypothetical protein
MRVMALTRRAAGALEPLDRPALEVGDGEGRVTDPKAGDPAGIPWLAHFAPVGALMAEALSRVAPGGTAEANRALQDLRRRRIGGAAVLAR